MYACDIPRRCTRRYSSGIRNAHCNNCVRGKECALHDVDASTSDIRGWCARRRHHSNSPQLSVQFARVVCRWTLAREVSHSSFRHTSSPSHPPRVVSHCGSLRHCLGIVIPLFPATAKKSKQLSAGVPRGAQSVGPWRPKARGAGLEQALEIEGGAKFESEAYALPGAGE